MTASRTDREKVWLQRAVAVGGLVPIFAGLFGVTLGTAMTGDTTSVSADSHFRYLSGLLLGTGLCFWACIPSIEEKTTLVRFLTVIVFIGGLGRLFGLMLTGVPSIGMLGGLAMELVVTPALCLWQTRIANRYADETGVAEV